jgi:hypothetical protein
MGHSGSIFLLCYAVEMAAVALATSFSKLSLGVNGSCYTLPPRTTTQRRSITMKLSQLTRFAKRLWARLSTAANQLFRHLTQPASSHLVTGTLADLPRNRSELLAEYLFSVQLGSAASASAKEPEKSRRLTIDKRRRVIYIGRDGRPE